MAFALSVPQAAMADDYAWQVAKPRGGVSLIYGSTTDIEFGKLCTLD